MEFTSASCIVPKDMGESIGRVCGGLIFYWTIQDIVRYSLASSRNGRFALSWGCGGVPDGLDVLGHAGHGPLYAFHVPGHDLDMGGGGPGGLSGPSRVPGHALHGLPELAVFAVEAVETRAHVGVHALEVGIHTLDVEVHALEVGIRPLHLGTHAFDIVAHILDGREGLAQEDNGCVRPFIGYLGWILVTDDIECRELVGGGAVSRPDAGNMDRGPDEADSLDEFFDILLFPFGHDFDRTVRHVPDPAGYSEWESAFLDVHPEASTLDEAFDRDDCPPFHPVTARDWFEALYILVLVMCILHLDIRVGLWVERGLEFGPRGFRETEFNRVGAGC
jgi:hypothetical protein